MMPNQGFFSPARSGSSSPLFRLFNGRCFLLLVVVLCASGSASAQWRWSVQPPYVAAITGNASSLAAAEAQMRVACMECAYLKRKNASSASYSYESDPNYFDPEYDDWKYSFGRELHHIFSGDSYNDLIQYLKSRYSSDANCPATSAETAGDWVNLFNPPYDPSVGDDLCSGNIAYPGWPGNGTLTCEGGLTITQYRGETCAGLERDFVPNRKRNTICAFTGYTRSHTSTLSFDDYTKAICYHGTSGSVTPPNSDINCGAEQTANPCIISTGDKVKAAQDFTSSSLGFTRYYNSTNTVNSLSIGMGWRHSYGDELYMYTSPQSGESYPRVVVWTNGNRIDLTPKSNSDDLEPSYTEVKSSDIDRVTPMNDEWHVFRENGNSRVYNAEGKLIRIHTRQGQVTSLNYDTQNRLATISDAYGRTISLEYSSELVNKATFPDGSQVLYGYDTNSNLISVTHPGVGNSAGQPLIYHYEDTRFPNHMTGITDENGDRTQTYTYDEVGRASSSEKAKTTSDVGQERIELEYQ